MTEEQSYHRYKKSKMDWWEERSLPEKIALGILFGIGGLALFAMLGWIVMLLWNWLMPDIFGLKVINYWQAWGLFLLSTLLFKGMGGGNSGYKDKRRKQKLRGYITEESSPQKPSAE